MTTTSQMSLGPLGLRIQNARRVTSLGIPPVAKGSMAAHQPTDGDGKAIGRPRLFDTKSKKLRPFVAQLRDRIRQAMPALAAREAAAPPRPKRQPGQSRSAMDRRRPWAAECNVPCVVHVIFWMKRPAKHFGTGRNADILKPDAPALPGSKPDFDKLTRTVMDVLTSAGVIHDDSIVVRAVIEKRYCPQPGIALAGVDLEVLW